MHYQLNTTNYADFAVFEQNKLPGRSYFIPYPARAQADAVSRKEKRYRSEKVVCLNGEWEYQFDFSKSGDEQDWKNAVAFDGRITVPRWAIRTPRSA